MPPAARKGDGHVKLPSSAIASGSSDTTKPATAPHLLHRDASPVTAAAATANATVPAPATRSHGHKLTSQFHWNLNHNALQCLSAHDRGALYQLFRFYDSSFQGDALPAIHCHRFLELLRDAQLLSTCDSVDHGELRVGTVESVFAQAVLGKLRAYLDADEQPALTFPLFCGALFSCAQHKFGDDATPPEAAFQTLVDALLAVQPHYNGTSGRGLVEHSERAAIPSWNVQELHGHEELICDPSVTDPSAAAAVAATSNYLHRRVFQDVLTGLSHDPRVDIRLQERLESLYTVPEELKLHFHSDHLAFVTARFRTFDVFDKGVLPRNEVFALLSGVAKRLEIVDVYEVLAVILAGVTDFPTVDRRAMPRGSLVLTMPSPVTHVTLVQILQALHVCRRSRSAAYAVEPTGSSTRTEESSGSQRGEGKATNGARPVRGDKRTRTRAAGNPSKPHVAVGGKAAAGARATQPAHHGSATTGGSGGGGKRSVAAAAADGVGGKRDKKDGKAHAHANDHAAMVRRLSKMSATSSEASASPSHVTAASVAQELHGTEPPLSLIAGPERGETEVGIVRHDSFQSIHSSSSASSSFSPAVKIPTSATARANASPLSTAVSVVEHGDASCDESQAHDVPPVLTLRMYYRHQTTCSGDESLDGSVCLTISLILSPSPGRVATTQGVYFQANGDRRDVWSTQIEKIDARLPLEGAVVVLRRIVAAKERDGFVLIPESAQREAMDTLEQQMRAASCPGYAMEVQRTRTPTGHRTPVQSVEPSLAHGYPLRRGGFVNKPSLDRGSTWVRQKSSSDLLAMVSDSLLQSHLKMKKRQSLLQATATLDPNGATRTSVRIGSSPWRAEAKASLVTSALPPAGPPPTEDYSQLMASWGLQHPLQQQHAWITALNDNGNAGCIETDINSDMRRRLGGCRSLPSLGGPTERSVGSAGQMASSRHRHHHQNHRHEGLSRGLAPIAGPST